MHLRQVPSPPPESLPWACCTASLLASIHSLPRLPVMIDITGEAAIRVHSDALSATLSAIAANPHNPAACAALALYPRWVLRRNPRGPPDKVNDPLNSPGGRAQAFRLGKWEELHSAFLAAADRHPPATGLPDSDIASPSASALRRASALAGMGQDRQGPPVPPRPSPNRQGLPSRHPGAAAPPSG